MKKLSLVIAGCLFVGLFEIALRIAIPDTRLNLLESVLTMCEEDPVLLWKQRPHLNTLFQNEKVTTNSLGLRNGEIAKKKPPSTLRILCLGTSSTFGWGAGQEETYPAVLGQMLNTAPLAGKIEVINAGQIGYTSYQGKKLLKDHLLAYSPDIITIEYVLNDIDQCRFFRNDGLPDSKSVNRSPVPLALKNLLQQSRLYFFLQRIAGTFKHGNTTCATALLKKRFILSTIRVSAQEYEKNIAEMVELCQSRGIKVVLINSPVNLSLPALNNIEKDFLANGFSLSAYYFNQAGEYEKRGQSRTAYSLYKKALDYQILECAKAGEVYHRITEKVARNCNVPLIDAHAALNQAGTTLRVFNGRNDPIHPNANGHRIIAEKLCPEISKIILSRTAENRRYAGQ